MYAPRYLALREAAQAVARHLAKTASASYGDLASALGAARDQLIQALCDGAIRSEGIPWQPLPPDDYELPPVLPPARVLIDRRFWSNSKLVSKDENYLDRSVLDVVTVHWDDDYLEYEDFGIPCAYMKVHVFSADLAASFGMMLQDTQQTPVTETEQVSLPIETPIYRSGVAGRPTSKDLVEVEMTRRAAEHLLCATLAAEARRLSEWLKAEHPSAPQSTAKAIENALRKNYWKLRRTTPPPRP